MIIHHTGVKSSAAAAASFEKHIREFLCDLLQEVIKSQDISVEYLSLSLCRQHCGPYVCHMAVCVPFYIFNIGAFQDLTHLIKDILSYISP